MNKNILVIGDAFIDRYWVGTSTRISPEAPIPVVSIEGVFTQPGGAANVRANLRALGEDGKMLFLPKGEKANFPIKNRLVVGNTQLARWDEKDYCSPFQRADLLPALEADAIIVSDYGKGSIGKEVIQVLHDYRGPLFVDTKRDPAPWLGSRAFLFPNLKEYQQYAETYEWFPNVLLKQGDKGMAWVQYGNIVLSSPAYARFVGSVNGAGDTVIAAFTSAFLSGADLQWCLKFASVAAAISVEGSWTTTPTYEVVMERVAEIG